MDPGSPISLDFNYPFATNSPQVNDATSNNGLVGNSAIPAIRNGSVQDGGSLAQAYSRQHRTSIDSMLDQDSRAQWSGDAAHQSQRHGSTASFGNDAGEHGQDQKSADDERLPAWSELKTKAGKERKRLPLACIACRRKKIKCSGEKPACKHCLKARVPCVYKVTTRKAAPRTDYMGMLDKRLKRMEDRVIKMIPKDDLPDLNATGRSSVRPPIPGQLVKKDKSILTNKRSAEEAFDSELNDWARSRKPVPNVLDKAAKTRNPREADNKLFTEGAESLPPQNIQEHLAEIFFDCVYGQSYLLLHKPSFMRKVKAGSVPPVLMLAVCAVSARFSTHPQVNSEPAFLRGEQWATPARTIVEKRHFEPNVTVLTVMIILGLHYFGTCEGGLSWSFGGQATRMGYALQLHQELGHDPLGQAQAERAAAFGKPVPKIPELSFTDREIRRRLMWACFLMDTFNSSGTERPSFLNENYVKIQLPIKESNFQLEMPGLTEDIEGLVSIPPGSAITPEQAQAEAKSNMGVAAYVMRAVVVWKRIVQYLNLGGKEKDSYPIWDPLSHFASLQRQIAQLDTSLPDRLKYTPGNLAAHVTKRLANQFLFLHIVIAQTGLFLHRFAIPTAPNVHRPYPPNTPKSFLASSAATVVESASQISRIIADSTGHTLTVPFAGYCAYASATVHVWGIFSQNAQLEAASKEHLRHNYRYLTRMKRYWGMFHYMAESVKDIYRAFTDAAAAKSRGGIPSSNKPSSTTIVTTTNTTTPAGETKSTIDSIAMSVDASRAATPTAGSEGDIDNPSAIDNDQTDPTRFPPRSKSDSASGKSMFQYGDWFNKYPHGVSETEWETTHLPHRNEAAKGTEAVMSQQSGLQSVDEYLASLSPPLKPETALAGGSRGKKVAKKRTKSLATAAVENVTSNPAMGVSTGKTREPVHHRQPQQMRTQLTSPTSQNKTGPQQQYHSPINPHHSNTSLSSVTSDIVPNNTSDIDFPMPEYSSQQQPLQSRAGSTFDMTSPPSVLQLSSFNNPGPAGPRGSYTFSIDSPATASNAGSTIQPATHSANTNANPQTNFNFNYTSALPHLDRQMVFGAYAGIDQSNSGNSAALNNPNNIDFWNSPWEGGMDVNGFNGFNDAFSSMNPSAGQMASNVSNMGMGQGVGGGAGNGAMNSSAWFMPFNIDPPEYGMDDFDVSGLEGMDLGGVGDDSRQTGAGSGAYTGQSNTPA